jgi:hypothetical protein
MTAKIPAAARDCTLTPTRGMFGRDTGWAIRFADFAAIPLKSKGAGTRKLKAAGFVRIGKPSPYSGSEEWAKLTPEEVAALPRPETSAETIARWRGKLNPRRGKKSDPVRERANERLEKIRERFPSALEGIAEFLAGNHAWIRSDARDDMIEYTLEHPDVIGRLKWGEVFELADYHARLRLPMANPVDSFSLRHLAAWIDSTIADDERDTARDVILEQLARDPDATDRGLSWREIYDIGLRNRNRKPLDTSAARFAKPDPRKRKRKAKANPSIVSGELAPLPGMKPPPTLALLAELVEMVVLTRDGERTIRPKPNAAAMLATGDGSALWFIWPTKTKRTATPPGASAAKRIYRKWSAFEPRVSLKFSTAEKYPATPIGIVRIVRYRSDKWTGKPELYEHRFTADVKAYADNAKAPKMILAFVPAFDERQKTILVSSRGLVN